METDKMHEERAKLLNETLNALDETRYTDLSKYTVIKPQTLHLGVYLALFVAAAIIVGVVRFA